MKVCFFAIIILSLTYSLGQDSKAHDDSMPPPPSGYTWQQFSEINSAFLKPNGWFFKHEQRGSAHVYVISQESVLEHGSFTTGLTLQVIKFIQKKEGLPASVFAIRMAQAINESSENTILSSADLGTGPFKAFGIRYRNAPVVGEPIIVHQNYIANDKRDTLFIVTFESPEKEWANAWAIGEKILKQFLIDDEY
ncbi:hypothetical protein SCOR_33050 [Sulfidibacter corallicola]|uniref:Uncharacterized protein n=1 Tax=Sulfidibacter corallicola TaxID=2818388 RepID=A0A8A4TJ57_SULCO|nr:hypothetical protein [Sulfidibacter corallicola]QTD49633.1 hypothetical protein J3U87_28945 [Sulfidibacter corallicola]